MSSRIRSSPSRPKLAEIKDGNGNNGTEEQHLPSSLSLWNSPSQKNLRSPPKRNTTTSVHTALFAASPSDVQPAKALAKSSKHNTPSPPLLHQANSPRLIRLDPRISDRCKSSPAARQTNGSQISYTEAKSIFYPHGHRHNVAAGSASSSESNAFTLTPTVMFSDEVNDQQTQKELRQENQQYHQSPHWTGKVRINPFSPVPPKYLEPPDSTKSLPSLRSFRGLPVLSGSNLSPMNPSTQFPQLGQRRSRRLKPKHETFPMVMENRVSPTDVTEDPFGMDSQSEPLCLGKSPCKRKADDMKLGLPQPLTSARGWESPNKQLKVPRSRYLEDFEEVSHLGSGSFGSVNACLSRLDGCMYAIKSVSPHGIQKSNLRGYNSMNLQENSLYGGRQTSVGMPPVPPTPRRDVVQSPVKRLKHKRNSSLDEQKEIGGGGLVSGTSHWTESALRRMLREVHALAALCSQADVRTFHIVRYQQAWFEDDGTLYIQTELCSNTLRDEMKTVVNESKNLRTLKSNNFINAPQRFKCLREILLALQLVHSKGMVHLDIKPDNIFVQNGLYKLGDFGLAGIATSTDVEEGDSRYMSREMLEYGQRDLTKCDIFSLGATMYELCLGRTLPSCGAEWHDIRNGKLTYFWPPSLYSVIQQMMDPDPAKRPCASELLSRDEMSCQSGGWLVNQAAKGGSAYNDSVYNLCLKETAPKLRRSSSWTM